MVLGPRGLKACDLGGCGCPRLRTSPLPPPPLQAGGWGPEWSAAQQATQEAVGRDLAALQRAWEQGGAPAQPHRPCRLVKRDARAVEGPGLRAAELTGALRIRESRLETALGQLQTRCRQELARLAGAEPGLIWILPPGR